MVGKNLLQVTLKKKDQAVTLRMNSKITKGKPVIQVDTTLLVLFQRLVQVAENNPESMESVFSFELCSVPASLFDTSGLPRQSNKSSLAQFLWDQTKQIDASIPSLPYPTFLMVAVFFVLCHGVEAYLTTSFQNATLITF